MQCFWSILFPPFSVSKGLVVLEPVWSLSIIFIILFLCFLFFVVLGSLSPIPLFRMNQITYFRGLLQQIMDSWVNVAEVLKLNHFIIESFTMQFNTIDFILSQLHLLFAILELNPNKIKIKILPINDGVDMKENWRNVEEMV